jgi:hypothetical protein
LIRRKHGRLERCATVGTLIETKEETQEAKEEGRRRHKRRRKRPKSGGFVPNAEKIGQVVCPTLVWSCYMFLAAF